MDLSALFLIMYDTAYPKKSHWPHMVQEKHPSLCIEGDDALNGMASSLNLSLLYKYLSLRPTLTLIAHCLLVFFKIRWSNSHDERSLLVSAFSNTNLDWTCSHLPLGLPKIEHIYHESLWSFENYIIRLNFCFVGRPKQHA
jgi:hypothetical protein